jgi:hypothetical protein
MQKKKKQNKTYMVEIQKTKYEKTFLAKIKNLLRFHWSIQFPWGKT